MMLVRILIMPFSLWCFVPWGFLFFVGIIFLLKSFGKTFINETNWPIGGIMLKQFLTVHKPTFGFVFFFFLLVLHGFLFISSIFHNNAVTSLFKQISSFYCFIFHHKQLSISSFDYCFLLLQVVTYLPYYYDMKSVFPVLVLI